MGLMPVFKHTVLFYFYLKRTQTIAEKEIYLFYLTIIFASEIIIIEVFILTI